jgi:hypothetical protein
MMLPQCRLGSAGNGVQHPECPSAVAFLTIGQLGEHRQYCEKTPRCLLWRELPLLFSPSAPDQIAKDKMSGASLALRAMTTRSAIETTHSASFLMLLRELPRSDPALHQAARPMNETAVSDDRLEQLVGPRGRSRLRR